MFYKYCLRLEASASSGNWVEMPYQKRGVGAQQSALTGPVGDSDAH